jgi:hypothetical protein
MNTVIIKMETETCFRYGNGNVFPFPQHFVSVTRESGNRNTFPFP